MTNQAELSDLPTLIERLRGLVDQDNNLPRHVRYCVGRTGEALTSKRLFVGQTALQLALTIDEKDLNAVLEKLGYASVETQRVPDGYGGHYDSVYFKAS